jgi:hypothetical protein
MNYQKLITKGKELFYDTDARKFTCRQCGDTIRFAQDSTGKYYPISSSGLQLHRCSGITKTELEKNIESEERNQEFINSL